MKKPYDLTPREVQEVSLGAEGDDVEVSIGGVVRAGVDLEHLLL
jgi:hypothetical protein